MEGNDINTMILKFLLGIASENDCDNLEAWLKDSKENIDEFLREKNLWEITHPAFNPDSIDEHIAERELIAAIRNYQKPKRRVYKTLWHYWQLVAAVTIFPIIIISLLLIMKRSQPAINTIDAQYGTVSHIVLPDKSNVWLNSGSSISYDIDFIKKKRSVNITGEAYFEVESDKQHPFIVKTDNTSIIATGTKFNVDSYDASKFPIVTLIEGKLSVETKDTSLSMCSGEMLNPNSEKPECIPTGENSYKWYSWKDGVIMFRGDNLEYVFKRLGQIFNVEFIINSSEIKSYPYYATFQSETLNEILRLLELSAPIKCEEIKDHNPNKNRNVIMITERP